MNAILVDYNQVYELIKQSCTSISPDVWQLLQQNYEKEAKTGAKAMLRCILDNAGLAGKQDKPVCQSPGFPTVYIRFGESSNLAGYKDFFIRALTAATKKGYLRPSIVHSLNRTNPGDNSGKGVPNFEFQYRPDLDYLEVIISFKGCGAELGNVTKTLTPTQLGKNLEGLKRLVLSTVVEAGGKPCPPIGLGIGIGGQMDVAAKLSREAISTRDWRDENPDPQLKKLEQELFDMINHLGIGPAGIGGDTTCLAVKIGMAATHTAICPVAINFHCWVARRAGVRFYRDGNREYLFGREVRK